jgi:restriction system protein
MPIPTYDKFIEPLLRFLAQNPSGASARDAAAAAADALAISEAEREERLPSGLQAVYKNRAGWAHDRLKRAGYSSSPRRGLWQLTAEGRDFAKQNPQALSETQVVAIATGHDDVRLRPNSPELTTLEGKQSPDERLEAALAEIRGAVGAELRDTLSRVSPAFFETIVLDVLHAMGYGASRSDLQRVGRTGDGGIDGIISLDRLGLEKVYVQAKRWKGSVGRPEIQGFYGALAGQRAAKGVFITTSTFSKDALEFARSVERIVLVDGAQLAGLMIDFEVGVSVRVVKVPKLDSDYFDE